MKVSQKTSCRRRGFATFTAVVLISIVAMALLALTLLFQADSRRTRHHWAETQLRQLLIAGAAAAVHTASADPEVTNPQIIQTPAAIEDSGLMVSYERDGGSILRATVTARIEMHDARQTLTFEKTGSGWNLQGTELDRHR